MIGLNTHSAKQFIIDRSALDCRASLATTVLTEHFYKGEHGIIFRHCEERSDEAIQREVAQSMQ